jgi:hypothetical protein
MAVRLALCGLDEVDALTAFLRDHWGREHVLVTDRRVLDRQHRDEGAGRYDAVLAWDGDEVVGVLGFIRTGRFDPALAGDRDTLWLTTWRARDDAPPGTGIALVRALERTVPHGWIGTVGMRSDAEPLYRGLGFRTGLLTRWVLVDPEVAPRLVRMEDGGGVPVGRLAPSGGEGPARPLVRLGPEDLRDRRIGALIGAAGEVPARSAGLVAARFLADPFYAYEVHLAERDGRGALLVSRCVEHAGARALRLVAVVGDPLALADTGPALLALLRRHGAEHAELQVAGAGDAPAAAGLHPVADVPGLVVPSRYDPFEAGGAALRYALRGRPGQHLLTRGDADQDRPNRPGAARPSA